MNSILSFLPQLFSSSLRLQSFFLFCGARVTVGWRWSLPVPVVLLNNLTGVKLHYISFSRISLDLLLLFCSALFLFLFIQCYSIFRRPLEISLYYYSHVSSLNYIQIKLNYWINPIARLYLFPRLVQVYHHFHRFKNRHHLSNEAYIAIVGRRSDGWKNYFNFYFLHLKIEFPSHRF